MLNLIQKLSTAMRGGAREVLEATVDANALRIFAQEINDCERNLQQAKQHLASVMAEQLKLKRQVETQSERVKHCEVDVRAKLQGGEPEKAQLLAEEMAQQETLLAQLQQQHDKLQSYEQRLLHSLKTTAHKLEQRRTELRVAQATQHAQQSAGKMSGHMSSPVGKFADMRSSLERIQHKQDDFDDQMQAMDEISAQLSGVPSEKQQLRKQADDILARLQPSTA